MHRHIMRTVVAGSLLALAVSGCGTAINAGLVLLFGINVWLRMLISSTSMVRSYSPSWGSVV